jgi:hypothetical protein
MSWVKYLHLPLESRLHVDMPPIWVMVTLPIGVLLGSVLVAIVNYLIFGDSNLRSNPFADMKKEIDSEEIDRRVEVYRAEEKERRRKKEIEDEKRRLLKLMKPHQKLFVKVLKQFAYAVYGTKVPYSVSPKGELSLRSDVFFSIECNVQNDEVQAYKIFRRFNSSDSDSSSPEWRVAAETKPTQTALIEGLKEAYKKQSW